MTTLYESWTSYDEGYYDSADEDALWQIFTPEADHFITSVILLLSSDVEHNGTLTVEIQPTASELPTGTVLCSGTFDIALIGEDTDNGIWTEVMLSGAGLSAGTNYAIVVRTDHEYINWFYKNDVGPYYNDKPEFSGNEYDGEYESWYPDYEQSYCFKEYGTTSYLSGSNLTDIKTELNSTDIWNDIRVMLPSYGYTLELVGAQWFRYPINLQARATDGQSINKYGRRTKTLNKHVPADYYAEAYCEGELAQRKEPIPKTELKLLGVDATNIVTALTTKVAGQISYSYSPAGLNATAVIDNFTLDVDLDGIPRLTLNLTDVGPLADGPDPPIPARQFLHIDDDTVDDTVDLIG